MTKLIEELTRMVSAIAAVAEYALEQEKRKDKIAQPVIATSAAQEPVAESKPKRGRLAKIEVILASAQPAPAVSAATFRGRRVSEMSEEEVAKSVYECGKLLIQRFPDPGAKGPSGQPAAEGFHICKRLLADEFKVASVKDLPSHAHRIQFMTRVMEILAAADSAATRPVVSAAVADPAGIGI